VAEDVVSVIAYPHRVRAPSLSSTSVYRPFYQLAESITFREEVPMTTEPALQRLNRLVGNWTTEATHPASPGLVVHGTADMTWLEGERFLIHRARTDHPQFPDSISIVGIMDRDRAEDAPTTGSKLAAEPRLCMHYFDSRGVFRVYDMGIEDGVWRIWRNAPGFFQRFTGTFARDGDTIDGRWELREDDLNWKSDLEITYRRRRLDGPQSR
jgi:hypothetical protein